MKTYQEQFDADVKPLIVELLNCKDDAVEIMNALPSEHTATYVRLASMAIGSNARLTWTKLIDKVEEIDKWNTEIDGKCTAMATAYFYIESQFKDTVSDELLSPLRKEVFGTIRMVEHHLELLDLQCLAITVAEEEGHTLESYPFNGRHEITSFTSVMESILMVVYRQRQAEAQTSV